MILQVVTEAWRTRMLFQKRISPFVAVLLTILLSSFAAAKSLQRNSGSNKARKIGIWTGAPYSLGAYRFCYYHNLECEYVDETNLNDVNDLYPNYWLLIFGSDDSLSSEDADIIRQAVSEGMALLVTHNGTYNGTDFELADVMGVMAGASATNAPVWAEITTNNLVTADLIKEKNQNGKWLTEVRAPDLRFLTHWRHDLTGATQIMTLLDSSFNYITSGSNANLSFVTYNPSSKTVYISGQPFNIIENMYESNYSYDLKSQQLRLILNVVKQLAHDTENKLVWTHDWKNAYDTVVSIRSDTDQAAYEWDVIVYDRLQYEDLIQQDNTLKIAWSVTTHIGGNDCYYGRTTIETAYQGLSNRTSWIQPLTDYPYAELIPHGYSHCVAPKYQELGLGTSSWDYPTTLSNFRDSWAVWADAGVEAPCGSTAPGNDGDWDSLEAFSQIKKDYDLEYIYDSTGNLLSRFGLFPYFPRNYNLTRLGRNQTTSDFPPDNRYSDVIGIIGDSLKSRKEALDANWRDDLNSGVKTANEVMDTYILPQYERRKQDGGMFTPLWHMNHGIRALLENNMDTGESAWQYFNNKVIEDNVWIAHHKEIAEHFWYRMNSNITYEDYGDYIRVHVTQRNRRNFDGLTLSFSENISQVKKANGNYLIFVNGNRVVLDDLNNSDYYIYDIYPGPYNASIPRISNVENEVDIYQADYNAPSQTVTINCSGSNNITLTGLNNIAGSSGQYEVFHNSVSQGTSSENDYTLSSGGVWEFRPHSLTCPGDIDGNGVIDYNDMVILRSQWLQVPGIPSADLAPQPYGDGTVNLFDFAVLAHNWLECPSASAQP